MMKRIYMTTLLHRYGWIVAYAALALAGLYIVLWLASYTDDPVKEQGL